MVKIIENENLEMNIENCRKIDIKIIQGNYLLIDLKKSKVKIHKNGLNCDACDEVQEDEDKLFNYKNILLCNKCLEEIKENGKIGLVIY